MVTKGVFIDCSIVVFWSQEDTTLAGLFPVVAGQTHFFHASLNSVNTHLSMTLKLIIRRVDVSFDPVNHYHVHYSTIRCIRMGKLRLSSNRRFDN